MSTFVSDIGLCVRVASLASVLVIGVRPARTNTIGYSPHYTERSENGSMKGQGGGALFSLSGLLDDP